jgi:hypothetical protein
MDRWDLVQPPGDPDDSSWLEEAADRALHDRATNESFLQDVLSPVTKLSRNFRGGISNLVSRHQYSNIIEMSQKLGCLVVWPPGLPIRVGDVGTFLSGISFARQTELSALDINVSFEPEAEPTTFKYSTDGLSVSVDGPVSRVDFPESGGTFLFATGLRGRRISDVPKMAQQVALLFARNQWPEEWHIVTEVMEADLFLLLVANDAGASVELHGIDLTSATHRQPHVSPTIGRQTATQSTFIVGPDAVPFFKAMKVNRRHPARLDAVNVF